MEFRPLKVEGAFEIIPRAFKDQRGYFATLYEERLFAQRGLQIRWLRDNQSANMVAGILRGLHFQLPPFDETKLVRAVVGRIFDVLVDLRRGSPTFGVWDAIELSDTRLNMVYIPKGCAHGYYTLTDFSIFAYKVDGEYRPEAEGGIIWNDPDLKINWQLKGEPILSDKDRKWGMLRDFASPF